MNTEELTEQKDERLVKAAIKRFAAFGVLFIIVILLAVVIARRYFIRARDVKDVSAYVKLGRYKELEYEAMDTRVSSEEAEGMIAEYLDGKSTYTEIEDRKNTATATGDVVKCTYVAMLGDEVEERGTMYVEIGSGKMPDFETAIIGQEVGSTIAVSAMLPEQNAEKFYEQGDTEVVFNIELTAVCEKHVPELTDEYAVEMSGGECTSAKDLKNWLKESIGAEREAYARDVMKDVLLDRVIEDSTFKNLDKKIELQYEKALETYEKEAKELNLSLEDYVYVDFGISFDEFKEALNEKVVQTVKEQLVLQAIANEQFLNVKKDSEIYNRYLPEYLENYGCKTEEELLDRLTETAVLESMTYDYALDYIMDHAVEK